jgi:hypothetical protein
VGVFALEQVQEAKLRYMGSMFFPSSITVAELRRAVRHCVAQERRRGRRAEGGGEEEEEEDGGRPPRLAVYEEEKPRTWVPPTPVVPCQAVVGSGSKTPGSVSLLVPGCFIACLTHWFFLPDALPGCFVACLTHTWPA